MKVVSNASPLINLARIGKLGLLRDLYEELTIPEAVWREVVVEGAGQPGADEIESAAWILRKAAGNRELVQALRQDFGNWGSGRNTARSALVGEFPSCTLSVCAVGS